MNDKIRMLTEDYWDGKLNKNQFVEKIQHEIGETSVSHQLFLEKVLTKKNADDLEYGLEVLLSLEENDNMIDLIHIIILEPWHREYEGLIHSLQNRKNPKSIPFIKKAMQQKYPYLESYGTGTRQFINQSGHALASIGTPEAINTIVELSQSNDPIIKDEMLYRISRLNGKNDYQRNY